MGIKAQLYDTKAILRAHRPACLQMRCTGGMMGFVATLAISFDRQEERSSSMQLYMKSRNTIDRDA